MDPPELPEGPSYADICSTAMCAGSPGAQREETREAKEMGIKAKPLPKIKLTKKPNGVVLNADRRRSTCGYDVRRCQRPWASCAATSMRRSSG